MATTTLYRVLLVVVHLTISLKELLAVVCCRMMKLLLTSAGVGDGQSPSVPAIRHEASRRLRRLPVHLGIVVVEEDLRVVDIVKIVAWSMAVGISYITIYDYKGWCKKNKATILRLLEEQKEQMERNGQNKTKCSTEKSCNGVISPLTGGGDCQRQKPKLQIVGPEDGRQHLTSVARHLSRQVVNCEIKNDDIVVPFVDAVIRGNDLDPDPDLVIKFGAVNSLLGFLPWQTRLTEIISLPTHHRIDFASFFTALDQFGYTEQRCGK